MITLFHVPAVNARILVPMLHLKVILLDIVSSNYSLATCTVFNFVSLEIRINDALDVSFLSRNLKRDRGTLQIHYMRVSMLVSIFQKYAMILECELPFTKIHAKHLDAYENYMTVSRI